MLTFDGEFCAHMSRVSVFLVHESCQPEIGHLNDVFLADQAVASRQIPAKKALVEHLNLARNEFCFVVEFSKLRQGITKAKALPVDEIATLQVRHAGSHCKIGIP